jgi:hypothetical protein
MDAVKTEGVLLPLLRAGCPEAGIPKERLAVDSPFFVTAENLAAAEPYFFDLDHILSSFTG